MLLLLMLLLLLLLMTTGANVTTADSISCHHFGLDFQWLSFQQQQCC